MAGAGRFRYPAKVAGVPNYAPLAAVLKDDPGGVLGRWLSAYERSQVRLPSPVDQPALRQLVSAVLESFSEALMPGPSGAPPRLSAGAAGVREVEKSVAFVGGSMGAAGASGFDVAALVLAFREVVLPLVEGPARKELLAFVEWLAVVAADSLATARERATAEKLREELEEGTPVVLITPELPAALFVGRPDGEVVRSVFGRLILSVVRVGAPAVIVDVSGMATPVVGTFAEALERFVGHRKVAGKVQLLAVGVPDAHAGIWRDIAARHDTALSLEHHFDAAVARGLAACGQTLVRR